MSTSCPGVLIAAFNMASFSSVTHVESYQGAPGSATSFAYRNSLKAYLEQRPSFSMLRIVSVLYDGSLEEFDENVSALRPTHCFYLRRADISEVRRELKRQCTSDL